MEPSIKQIKELSPNAIYHIQLAPPYSSEGLLAVSEAVKTNGLKALITGDNVEISTLVELFGKLEQSKKDEILAILAERPKFTIDEPESKRKLVLDWVDSAVPENAVNPINHEQTK